jgi:hypothetical protein
MKNAVRSLLVLAGISCAASAAIIGQATFVCLNDSSAACATLGSQMQIQATDEAPAGQIDIRIRNLGPVDSIIGEVFFDTGSTAYLESIASIAQIGSGNVQFVDAGAGGTLPGGNGNPYKFSTDFGVARVSKGGIDNGINPGEQLQIIFNLADGKTLADLKNVTGGPLDLSKLRVGIHVQAIDGLGIEGSRGMITGGPIGTPRDVPGGEVPEPSSYLMGASALAMLGMLYRRRKTA